MDDSPPVSNLTPLLDTLARLDSRLARIEQRLDQVERVAQLEHALTNVAAITADSLDDAARRLQERGVDIEERLAGLLAITEKVTAPEALSVLSSLLDHLPSFDRLLSSGVLGAAPVEVVARGGQALAEAQHVAVRPIGALGLLRALSDADVQHALGFAIAFARAFGRQKTPSYTAPVLTTGARSTNLERSTT